MPKAKPQWIPEKQALELLGYKVPRRFRMLVKMNVLNIAYTTVNGRKFKYDRNDIDRILIENSTYSKRL